MSQLDHKSDDLRRLICFNFYLGWRAVQEYYKPSFDAGMGPQRMYALALCDRKRPTTMTKIAEGLEINLPAVSALIERMEADGLVQRQRSIHDRRIVEVFLTDLGQSTRARNDEALRRADGPLLDAHIRDSDIEALRRVVAGLQAAARSSADRGEPRRA